MNALARRWLTLVFIVVAGAMLWATFGLSRISGWIPQAVLVATLVFLLGQAALDWRSTAEPGARRDEAVRLRREQAALLWISGLLLSAWLLGVIAGSALFCFAWLRWHAAERWLTSFAFAVVFGAVLWAVFALLLGAVLYPGLLGRSMI